MRRIVRMAHWPSVFHLTILFLVAAAPASAKDKGCAPTWYNSLPRDNDWFYGAGKGADAEASRRNARENLAVQAIGSGQDIPVEALAGWEQDDFTECPGEDYALVRIEKARVRKEVAHKDDSSLTMEAAVVYRGEAASRKLWKLS